MHRVLVDSELKPLGELVEGERDLLGATEVWQAVRQVLAAAPKAARLPCSVQRLLINSELKPLGEKVEGQRDLLGATEVWQAVW
jgi:hypothetical protein